MTYSIILYSEAQKLTPEQREWLFQQVHETSCHTVRHSVTEPTQCVLKWDCAECPLDALGIVHTDYDYEGALALMETPDWYDPNM